jgi:hypothetical protein
VFLIVPDLDAADLKFRAGELHGLDDVKPENYNWYRDNQQKANFTLHDLGPDLNTNHFWFNLNKVQKPTPGKKLGEPFVDPVKYSWFNNPTFRRAVSLAIDRDAMIPSVFFGEAVKNWAIATPGNKEWYSPDLVRFDYNSAEAGILLAGMGWKDSNGDGIIEDARGNPVTFSLKTNSSNTTRIAMMNFIKADLAKVGINVITAPVDFNTLITNLRSDFQYEAMLLGLQSGVPPDPAMMQNVWRSTGLTHAWFLTQAKPGTPQEARIDRLKARANTKAAEAQRTHKQAHDMASVIPFGQPILVGHHSEGRDRRYRARISGKFERSMELSAEADELVRRAAAAEDNHAISSDDPDACTKIAERIAKLEENQRRMKEANNAWRKAGADGLRSLGWSEELVTRVVASIEAAYSWQKQPFPSYSLTNNNANIRRLRERLTELQQKAAHANDEPTEETIGLARLEQNYAENRVRLFFPAKPPRDVIQSLKRNGFHWSRANRAWQRQLSHGAVYEGRRILTEFAATDSTATA